MDVTNKTNRPVRVPLPGGKKLHLGPSKTAQITPKAAEHPALLSLVEEGLIELGSSGRKRVSGGEGGGSAAGPAQRKGPAGGMRHTGDR